MTQCRAYVAEDAVFRRRRQRAGIVRAREVTDKLCAHFGVEPIHVRHTRRRHPHVPAGSWFWHPTASRPPRISLDLDAADYIVCHEVAHYVAFVRAKATGRRSPGHDRTWAAIYVEAVRVAISGQYADRLARAFTGCGLLPKVELS